MTYGRFQRLKMWLDKQSHLSQRQRCTETSELLFSFGTNGDWRVNALSGGENGISSDSSGVLLISDLQSHCWTARKLKWIKLGLT